MAAPLFGKSVKRSYPAALPPPSYRTRYMSYDDGFTGAWRAFRYYTPAFIGGDVLLNVTPTKSNLEGFYFPQRFYDAVKLELPQVFQRVPSGNDREAFAQWLTHITWCVYSMLMASNVYPQLWSDALRFADDPEWYPPQYGWKMGLEWIAKNPPAIVGKDHPFLRCWADTAFGLGGSEYGMSRAFAYTQWYADEVVSDSGKQRWQPQGWLTFMPWAGIWGNPQGKGAWSEAQKKAFFATDASGDKGLQLFYYRALAFGGVDKCREIANLIIDKGLVDEAVFYWIQLANFLLKIDYWAFVRGGVLAWKWRTLFMFYQQGPGFDAKNPLVRQDMRSLLDAHLDQKAMIRRMQAVALTMKVAKIFYKAIQGDLVGVGQEYYNFAKWERQQQKVADSNIPPDRLFFEAPPLFIRAPIDTAYRPDVCDDQSASVCDANGKNCESATGTAAALVNVQARIKKLEGALGRWLWEKPAFADPSKVGIKVPASVLVPSDGDPSFPWVKTLLGIGVVGGLSYFVWRRK